VQPVRQLDEHYTDIVAHCQEDLAQGFIRQIFALHTGSHGRQFLGRIVDQSAAAVVLVAAADAW